MIILRSAKFLLSRASSAIWRGGPLLFREIIRSVFFVGFYFGIVSAVTIGTSCFLLLRSGLRKERTEKKIAKTTGFIAGQLIMAISFYYGPMYLVLAKPHTITLILIWYWLVIFVWGKKYWDLEDISMSNLGTFVTHLIFPLLNHMVLPSATLARLLYVYMYRCENKYLFLTGSMLGSVTGQILFLKSLQSLLSWLRSSMQSENSLLNNTFVFRLKEPMLSKDEFVSTIIFLTCIFSFGRTPVPLVSHKLLTMQEMRRLAREKEKEEEREKEKEKEKENAKEKEEKEKENAKEKEEKEKENENEEDVKGKEEDGEGEKEKEENDELSEEEKERRELLVTLLYDYEGWSHPERYIKNEKFDHAVRNKTSQYFFYTCLSDGKQKISFTYPPSLYAFFKMLEKRMSLYTTEKLFSENKDLYNSWVYTNEQAKQSLNNELINRIKAAEKQINEIKAIEKQKECPLLIDVLEKRIRLYNDDDPAEGYLPPNYDPFLNGPDRGKAREDWKDSITEDWKDSITEDWKDSITEDWKDSITATRHRIKKSWRNKIHSLLRNDSREFEDQENPFVDFVDIEEEDITNDIEEEDITKDVPRRLYPLNEEYDAELELKRLEEKRREKRRQKAKEKERNKEEEEEEEDEKKKKEKKEDYIDILPRKNKDMLLYTDINEITQEPEEFIMKRYAQRTNFRRDLVKGSMRVLRRKIPPLSLANRHVRSALFLYQSENFFLNKMKYSLKVLNIAFKILRGRAEISEIQDCAVQGEKIEKEDEIEDKYVRMAISNSWDTVTHGQAIRGMMLLTQSFLRKHIKLPFFIIMKHVGRMLLFQSSEWVEDWKAWDKEMYVKCTYSGIQLSEDEFPEDWLKDGIQIKILFPFCVKPWKGAKVRSDLRDKKGEKEDFVFLTIWGRETQILFGRGEDQPSFFEPVLTELNEKYRKVKNKYREVEEVFKREVAKFLRIFIKEIKVLLEKISKIILSTRKYLIEKNIILKYLINPTGKDIPMVGERDFLFEKEMEDLEEELRGILYRTKRKILINSRIRIMNDLEMIQNRRKKFILTRNILSPKNQNGNDKKQKLWQNLFRILKKRRILLRGKLRYFRRTFIPKTYNDLVLYIINILRSILRINIELLVESIMESINKTITKYSRLNQEEIDEAQRKPFLERILSNTKKSKNFNTDYDLSLNTYYDLSSLSQAYVFYKISQTPFSDKYGLKPVLEYDGTRLFLKDQIKNYCERQGIFDPKTKHKKIEKSIINEWKNWLKGRSQYNLSHTKWSEIKREANKREVNKRKRKVNKRKPYRIQKKEKNPSIAYERKVRKIKNDSKSNPLISQKEKFNKNCRYDLLLHKYLSDRYINYENKGDCSIFRSPLKGNRNQEILSNWNKHLIDFLVERYIGKKPRKAGIFHFFTKPNQKINRKTWRTNRYFGTNMNRNQKTKTKEHIYQELAKENILPVNEDYISLRSGENLYSKIKFFDWMGMNNEKVYRLRIPKQNPFLPEFGILFNRYKPYHKSPWIIPIESFLEEKEFDVEKEKNLDPKEGEEKKSDPKDGEEKKSDPKEGEEQKSDPKDGEEKKLDPKKQKKLDSKKQKKSKAEVEREKKLQLRLEKIREDEQRLILFLTQCPLYESEKGREGIKSYIDTSCLLLRLVKGHQLRRVFLSDLERKKITMQTMRLSKTGGDLGLLGIGLLVIKPIYESPKLDENFIMYQMLSIDLVNNRKYEPNEKSIKNEKCLKEEDVDNDDFKKSKENPNYYDSLVPEDILSTRHRRKLRILNCFHSRNRNSLNEILAIDNENSVKGWGQFRNEDNYPDKNTNKLIKLKLFSWPNFRLEDLACMNRYWFNTNNGTRFTMSRIHMYPRFPIN